MYKIHFFSDLREESEEFFDMDEYTGIALCNDQGLFSASGWDKGHASFLDLPVVCDMQFKPETSRSATAYWDVWKKLGWRRAGANGGEPWSWFYEKVFKFEPVAHRSCQKQKDKENGQR